MKKPPYLLDTTAHITSIETWTSHTIAIYGFVECACGTRLTEQAARHNGSEFVRAWIREHSHARPVQVDARGASESEPRATSAGVSVLIHPIHKPLPCDHLGPAYRGIDLRCGLPLEHVGDHSKDGYVWDR